MGIFEQPAKVDFSNKVLGTWWAIIAKKEWLLNPVDDSHAMYCSAFVRHCYKEAGADFLGRRWTSQTQPLNTSPTQE